MVSLCGYRLKILTSESDENNLHLELYYEDKYVGAYCEQDGKMTLEIGKEHIPSLVALDTTSNTNISNAHIDNKFTSVLNVIEYLLALNEIQNSYSQIIRHDVNAHTVYFLLALNASGKIHYYVSLSTASSNSIPSNEEQLFLEKSLIAKIDSSIEYHFKLLVVNTIEDFAMNKRI